MAQHVNEYFPKTDYIFAGNIPYIQPTRGIEEDFIKLKFNNLQSCIAVGIAVYNDINIGLERSLGITSAWGPNVIPTRTKPIFKLFGIHFNTTNLDNGGFDLNMGIAQLRLKLTNHKNFDIYIVGPYSNYVGSNMVNLLKSLNPGSVKLFDVPFKLNNQGVSTDYIDKDVKMERAGTQLNVFYRDHVISTQEIKTKYVNPNVPNVARPLSQEERKKGRNIHTNDRNSKPWHQITNFQSL